jgi:hypothetical protein
MEVGGATHLDDLLTHGEILIKNNVKVDGVTEVTPTTRSSLAGLHLLTVEQTTRPWLTG